MSSDKKFLDKDYSSNSWRSSRRELCKKKRATRLYCIFLLSLCWAGCVVFRLYTLQISEVSHWRSSALKQHNTTIELASERGTIVDRNGKILASSVPASSIYVRPARVKDKALAAEQVADVLKLPVAHVRKKLDSRSPFVWIKRQIPRVQARKVEALKLRGVGQLLEARRYYPYNAAAGVLIGKVGVDGDGLSGIEARYNTKLRGENTRVGISRDAFGQRIELPSGAMQEFSLPKGDSLQLTLDTRMQLVMDEELERGRVRANAKYGLALMADATTGEILAMSQAPSLNLNARKLKGQKELRNLVVESVFEPGSVMKPIVAAAAMQAGVIGRNEILDCEKGSYRFGRHTINDVHGSDQLSLHQVVVQSSNIGMTKVGMRLGAPRLHQALSDFGFGKASQLGLAGETPGILRSVKNWAKVDVATHAYGQGVAVTPLQMVRAVSAIANGGYLPELHVVSDMSTKPPKQILSPAVARAAREMMYGVVEDEHGTGKRAAVQGVRIGGKTGTAQRARDDGRGYESGSYVASFVGFANGEDVGIERKLVLYVVMDRPNTNSIYGGTLAGPVFQRIMQRSLHILMTDRAEWSDLPNSGKHYDERYRRDHGFQTVAYRR